ncbi:MAG TPA: hypothetical protein ENI26_11335 [Methylophaga aminisulfidivorans]|uniref:Uncharacterized protein n=2 Tax=root TaxID=1 RepID=A0A7C1ZRD7_9GAMM|nr:hypothetical protein [Methylophaga aminisulfidivorans]HEC74943.1 hypothetical protein [Methylophaga aminisulfidivorans]
MLKLLTLFTLLTICFTAMANEEPPFEQAPGNNINEIALPLTKDTAAELAKIETAGKVLSVDEERYGNRIVFRIKVLHNNGKVKIHRLDRDTGHAIP